jgi:hypothetical protein
MLKNAVYAVPVLLIAAVLWWASNHTKDGQSFSRQPKWVISLEVIVLAFIGAGYVYALINNMAF